MSFLLILLVPLAASAEALVAPGLVLLDAGASTPCTRAVLNSLVLMCVVFLLLLPPAGAGSDPSWRARVPSRALACFLAVWLFASITSVCVPDSLLDLLGWGVAASFFVVCRELADSRRALEQMVHALLAVSVVVMLVSFRLYLGSPEVRPAITGAFYQADVAAGYFLLLAPIAASLFMGAQRWDQRIFYGCLSIFLFTSLVLTYSRAGLLAGMGALAMLAVLAWPRHRMWALVVPLGVLGLSFVIAGLVASGGRAVLPAKTFERASELVAAATERPKGSLAERQGRVADTSVTARLNFYRGGWCMALARPAFGWGPSTFGRIFPRYQDDVRFYSKYAHSAYVTILSESGFLGGLAFIAFLLSLARAAWFQRGDANTCGPWNGAAVNGLIAALMGVLVHVTVDVDWEFQMLLVLFMGLAGLLTSRGAVSTDEAVEEELVFTTHPTMVKRWVMCVPVMGLLALQPFPFLSRLADTASVVARQNGNLDEAISMQRQAVSYMPFDSAVLRQLGETLLMKAEARSPVDGPLMEQAARAADMAVDVDPCRAVNLDLLGRVAIARGDLAGGESAERRAIAADPVNYPKFYNTVAEILMQGGRDQAALDLLMDIAGRYPPEMFPTMWFFRQDALREQLSQTWCLIGMIRLKLGRTDDAIMAFTRSVEMNGGNITARFQLGTIYQNSGRPGLAFSQFVAIQRRKPEHPVSRWLVGLSLRALGQFERATELLEQAYRAMPALRDAKGDIRIPRDFFVEPPPPPSPLSVASPQ